MIQLNFFLHFTEFLNWKKIFQYKPMYLFLHTNSGYGLKYIFKLITSFLLEILIE